jgi:hypothetical protein
MFEGPYQVIQEAPNRLSRHRWIFVIEQNHLVLDRYHYEKRRKKADPYKLAKFYDASGNGDDYGNWEWVDENDVPWDEDLQGEALGEVVKTLLVVRRSDLGGHSVHNR